MTCESCGARTLPTWDFCRACGADLQPEVPPEDEPRLIPHISLPRVSLRDSLRERRWSASLPQPASLGGAVARARARVPRGVRLPDAGRLPRPGWKTAFAAVAGFLAVAFVVAVGEARQSSSELGEERATAEQLQAQVAQLQQALDERDAAADTLRAEVSAAQEETETLRAELDSLQAELAEAEGASTSTRERLAEAQSQLSEYEAQLSEQQGEIDALRECLSGARVAIEFGRQDSWNSADRALDAVQEHCERAGIVL